MMDAIFSEDKAGDGIESLRNDDDSTNNEDGWVKLKKPKTHGHVEDLIMLFGGGSRQDRQDVAEGATTEQQRQQVRDEAKIKATTAADHDNAETKPIDDEEKQSQESSNKSEGFWGRLSNRKQNTTPNLISTACLYGAKIMEVGLDIAHIILSDDEDDIPRHEDNVMFNGYKILVSGRFIHLDCVRRNFENQNQLQAVAKFSKMKRRFLEPHLTLGDGTWCLDFGEAAGFIQVQVPSGVDAAEVTYEGPFPEGVVIVNMSPTKEFPTL